MIIQDKSRNAKTGSWSVKTKWQKIKLHDNSMECFKKPSRKEKEGILLIVKKLYFFHLRHQSCIVPLSWQNTSVI